MRYLFQNSEILNKEFDQDLKFITYISAISLDVGHKGKNNDYYRKSNHKIS